MLVCLISVALGKAQLSPYDALGPGPASYGLGSPLAAALSSGINPYALAGYSGAINPYAQALGRYPVGLGLGDYGAAQGAYGGALGPYGMGLGAYGGAPGLYRGGLGAYGGAYGGALSPYGNAYGLGGSINPYLAALQLRAQGLYGGGLGSNYAALGLGGGALNPAVATSGLGVSPYANIGRISPYSAYAGQGFGPVEVPPDATVIPVAQPAAVSPAALTPAPVAPAAVAAAVGVRPGSTYQFGYGVQTADASGPAEYGHHEEKSPVGTSGSYHVNTAGSYQYVNYNVPETGIAAVAPVAALG